MRKVSRALLVVMTLAGCGYESSPTGPDPVPPTPPPLTDCRWLGISAPSTIAVGVTRTLGVFHQFCRPNFFPLRNDQVTWTSVNPDVASVDVGVVTTFKAGAAVIGAASGRTSQEVLIIVGTEGEPPASPSVLAIYGSPTMTKFQRGSFGAYTVTPDGTVARVTTLSEWRSSNPAVLGASGPGFLGGVETRSFDAHLSGSATITATYRGATASMVVDVR